MAHNDIEISQRSGQPVQLFLFTYGTGVFAFTNADFPVLYDGVTYVPETIKTDDFKADGKAKDKELKIEVPITNSLAQEILFYPPDDLIAVRIREGHVASASSAPDWLQEVSVPTTFIGTLFESTRSGAICTFVCESSSAGMSRPGLRLNYQRQCPYALYSERCGASRVAATDTATVVSVSGNAVTLNSGWYGATDLVNYIGGQLEWTTSSGIAIRTILRAEGDVVYISGPARGLAATASVNVILGCPRTMAGCRSLHSNILNYGGQASIPQFHPFGKNNHT